ncbi:MAG TPA: hypothetical protein VK721_03415 [Solirubrobacteraceae bacterium]|jgi:hypothetical protein|nr:hypothetical protein [Solirubrobacteraceae bacterium]
MRTKQAIAALLTLMAIGLAFAANAMAASEADVGWRVNGKALGEAETEAITGQAEGNQAFKLLAGTFECTKLELVSSKLIGAGPLSPASGEGRISYSGCGVVGFAECTINGKLGGGFLTKPLVITTAYLTKSAAEKEELAAGANGFLLAPKEGTTFATFTIGGSRCLLGEKEIVFGGTGVIFKMIKGPTESVYNEELQKHLFQTTELKAYFVNTLKSTVEHTGVEMNAKYTGKLDASVATGSSYNFKT